MLVVYSLSYHKHIVGTQLCHIPKASASAHSLAQPAPPGQMVLFSPETLSTTTASNGETLLVVARAARVCLYFGAHRGLFWALYKCRDVALSFKGLSQSEGLVLKQIGLICFCFRTNWRFSLVLFVFLLRVTPYQHSLGGHGIRPFFGLFQSRGSPGARTLHCRIAPAWTHTQSHNDH